MKKTKRLMAYLMVCVMAVGLWTTSAKADESSDKASYNGGYEISSILSQFQFFVETDVDLGGGGHTVGSVAVGGSLSVNNTFGDAGIVPSYVNHLTKGNLGSGWHGAVPIKCDIVYYGTSDVQFNGNPAYVQNDSYMGVADAFDAIKTESAGLVPGDDYVHPDYVTNDGSIKIDLTNVDEDVYLKFTYEEFKNAGNFNFTVPSEDWFRDHICVISITGADGEDFTFDGYSKININGTQLGSALEKMSGEDPEYHAQLNINGMNLLWNLPDASGTITAQGLGGHFIAPNANVYLNDGNYEGGIISKSLSGSAQGHFYPMSKQLSGENGNTPGGSGANVRFSKMSETGSDEIPGAIFELAYVSGTGNFADVTVESKHNIIKGDDNKLIKWVSTTETLVLNNLPDGEYIMTETMPPLGYHFSEGPIKFKIENGQLHIWNEADDGYTTDGTDIVMRNLIDPVDDVTGLKITKKSDSGKPVAGADLKLTYEGPYNLDDVTVGASDVTNANNIVTWTTDDTAAVDFSGLTAGLYTLTEETVPNGYVKADPIVFRIADARVFILLESGEWEEFTGTELVMTDVEQKGSIKLKGTKAITGDTAPSEKYKFVVKENGVQVATGEVDGAGDIDFTVINYGAGSVGTHTYTITETANDTNGMTYDSSAKTITVTVSVDPDDSTKLLAVADKTVTFTNNYTAPTVNAAFSKKIKSTTTELAGAGLSLVYTPVNGKTLENVTRTVGPSFTLSTDKLSISWTSTTTPLELAGLPIGEYELVEGNAPVGYKKAASVKFKVENEKIYMWNGTAYSTTPVANGVAITMYDETRNSTSIKLPGTKAVTGDGAPAATYNFVVSDASGTVATGQVATTGTGTFNFDFSAITYTSVGTYTYTVTETAGTAQGITYDTTSHTVVVEVIDDPDNDTELKAYIKTVDNDADGVIGFENTYNDTLTSALTVSKLAKKGGTTGTNQLAGAEMKLSYTGIYKLKEAYDAAVAVGEAVTLSADEKTITWSTGVAALALDKLPAGTYILSEENAPVGYQKAADIEFKIQAGKIYLGNGDGTYAKAELTSKKIDVVDNERTGSFVIPGVKVLTGDAAPKETYTFEVKKVDSDEVVSTGSVTGAGTIEFTPITYGVDDIGENNYVITELNGGTPGMAYDSAKNITVIVGLDDSNDSKLKAELFGAPLQTEVTFTNDYTDTAVATATFSKKADRVNGSELAGAKLSLVYTGRNDLSGVTCISGHEIAIAADGMSLTWTSNGTAIELTGLPNGEYTMVEGSAPEGYNVADDIEFKVVAGKVYLKKNGSYASSASAVITMVDKAKTGNLIVTVHDEKTGETVPDATVNITFPDGSNKDYTTDKNGQVIINDTPIGEYEITTTEVPDGYEITEGETETAEVKEDETTKHDVYITPGDSDTTDTPPADSDKGNLIVTVHDEETGEPVPDATVEITYPDGTVEEYVTNSDGTVELINVPEGEYEIVVKKVPDGYEVVTGKTETAVVKAGETTKHDVLIATATSGKSSDDSAAQTGDNFNMTIPVILMLLSMFGFILISNRKKEDK